MKKLVSIILVIISLFAFQSAKAELPPGITCYDPSCSVNEFTILIGDCEYKVWVCYQCSVTDAARMQLTAFQKVSSNCENSLSLDEVTQSIGDYIISEAYFRSVCTEMVPAPCDQGTNVTVEVYAFGCWEKHNLEGWGIVYEKCMSQSDNIWCNIDYKICWNPITQKYETQEVYRNFYSFPNSCTSADLEPADPAVGQTSSCFYIKTPCEED